MNLNYLNNLLNTTKSKEDKASDASLLRLNVGKKHSSTLLPYSLLTIRYSLFAIVFFFTAILPNKILAQFCTGAVNPAPISATATTICQGATTTLTTLIPTGGDVVTPSVANGRVHKFTTAAGSNFVNPTGFAPTVEVLVVAGGGSGSARDGGGGGAGGFLYNTSFATVAGNNATSVGSGGNAILGGGSFTSGNPGNNSTFTGGSTLTAIGGGAGGRRGGGTADAGGSGGGAGGDNDGATAPGAGTPGPPVQGYSGGDEAGYNYAGGGGGGAGGTGGSPSGPADAAGEVGGAGGIGVSCSITGVAVTYAGGGGGGGKTTGGAGGSGVGGTGGTSTSDGTAGAVNTGSGGGAGRTNGYDGGAGATGIIIVRYPDVSQGTWSSLNPTIATVSGNAPGGSSVTATVTGQAAGTATIRYTYCTSYYADYAVTVTATQTAGAASRAATLCINTSLASTGGNITHTTTGATGIANDGVSGGNGLPTGVSATWAGNTITISGTPTASGSFPYSIALTGGCGTVNATGTITVTAANTAGAASRAATLCINTSLASTGGNITHTTTGATGIANDGVSGGNSLPAGVSATWSGNTITISGTPTASGSFPYSIALTGGCGTVNATGTITVTAANTVGAASRTATLCINTALSVGGNITHTTTGATGIANDGVSGGNGLPTGVSATWSGGTITISGTPTASGSFPYSIALTGGCGTVNATGTITVTAANTVGAASRTATLCINTALSVGGNITHTTTGATGIANDGVSGGNGLPAGVSATWSGNTITISGTPTASGSFPYSILLTGGCGTASATGTITVNPATAISSPQPASTTVVVGATAIFTVVATGTSLTYVWKEQTPPDPAWNPLSEGLPYTNVATASLSVRADSILSNRKYQCTVSGTCGSSVTSDGAATLTIRKSGARRPCYGVSQNYHINPEVSGTTYTWVFPAGWVQSSGGTTSNIYVTPSETSGNIVVTPSNCSGNGTALTFSVTVATVSVAASATTICTGASVTFTATPANASTGGTPTYQWVKNGVDIGGANASTYATSGLVDNDAIQVRITSTTATGGCGYTSQPIYMVVNNTAGLSLTSATGTNAQSICSNSSAITSITYTVTGGATGATVTGLPPGVTGAYASGVCTISGTPTSAAGSPYTYTVTTTGTCTPQVTATGTITVTASVTPSVSIAASTSNTICSGTSVVFTATPTNGGTPTYQWKNGAANVGTNSATFTTTSLANNDAISVIMTSSVACANPAQPTSNTITMTVNSAIVNNIVSAAQVICTGTSPAILTGTTPTGGNGAYTYQWESDDNSGFTSPTNEVTTYTINPGVLTATTWYRRVATAGVCTANTSAAIEITVNTDIANNSISAAQSICSGVTPSPLAGLLPTGGNGLYTYQWQDSPDNSTFTDIAGATSQDYTFPAGLAANTWYKRVVTSAPCAASTSAAIAMTINPNLAASVTVAASPSNSICNGTSVVFTPTPTNGGTAPTYQWTKNGSNISGETFNTYTTSSLANNDAIRVVMTSNASPCLTGSPATSAPVTMTVNAIPVATATNSTQTTLCSGGTIEPIVLGTSNGVTGTTFSWVRDNLGVTGIAASGTGVAIGGSISGTLTNSTTSAVTVTFTITPTGPANTNCVGNAITATVIVNPAFPATPGAISGITNTYTGFTEPYSIAAVANATSYNWTVPSGWTAPGTTNSITSTAGSSGTFSVTATNACGTSPASTLYVTVVANTTVVSTACEGTTQRYTTQYREGVTYDWTVPADWTIVSGDSTNSILVTIGATAGNVEVTASNSCGAGTTPQTTAVTANPLPVMSSPSSANTCSGVAINIPLTANPASTFEWEANDRSTTTGESVTTQTVTTITDVITTTAGVIDTVIYSVIPTSAAGCVGGGTAGSLTPQQVIVKINPSNHWTGAAGDRRWRTAGNWCVVPTCTSDAFIPTSPTGGNFPQVEFPDAICRNLTISTGASLELLSNNLALCGNWVNNGTFTPSTYKVTFQGSANQTVGGSVASNTFYDLQISNSGSSGSDNVTLDKPATVTNVLNLSNGILVTSSTNLLTLTNAANTATNAGNSGSYVSGPMRWNGLNGAGPFVFPTGKGSTNWARIGIKDLTSATDFTAEYFNTPYANVGPSFMSTTAPVLTNVSTNEYWNFDRVSGTGNGKVSLYWENATWSGITDCSEDGPLQIAHWNSGISKWENNMNADNNEDDIGAGSTCGGATNGYITTTSVVTTFSPFTFGNDDPLVNPLPVELLYFNAKYNGKTVDIKWQTASEVNNDYFTVERSIDGVNFITVGVIVPSHAKGGNSTSILNYYLNDDKVAPGIYYYRLKQTDFNGEFKYSNIDVVEIKGNADFSFNISPNPSDGTALNSIITAEKDQEIVIVVYDVLGQEIYSQLIVTEQKGNTVYAIDLLQKLSSGVYMITATSNQKIYTKRLVVN